MIAHLLRLRFQSPRSAFFSCIIHSSPSLLCLLFHGGYVGVRRVARCADSFNLILSSFSLSALTCCLLCFLPFTASSRLFLQGGYVGVRRVVRLMEVGDVAKRMTDAAIDANGQLLNLRMSILK